MIKKFKQLNESNVRDLMNCEALRKVNRTISEFDPLGEEDWDE